MIVFDSEKDFEKAVISIIAKLAKEQDQKRDSV